MNSNNLLQDLGLPYSDAATARKQSPFQSKRGGGYLGSDLNVGGGQVSSPPQNFKLLAGPSEAKKKKDGGLHDLFLKNEVP